MSLTNKVQHIGGTVITDVTPTEHVPCSHTKHVRGAKLKQRLGDNEASVRAIVHYCPVVDILNQSVHINTLLMHQYTMIPISASMRVIYRKCVTFRMTFNLTLARAIITQN